jgi:acetylornithine deacetylase/succinyl-diaminopimelate desuccinylase-like protein
MVNTTAKIAGTQMTMSRRRLRHQTKRHKLSDTKTPHSYPTRRENKSMKQKASEIFVSLLGHTVPHGKEVEHYHERLSGYGFNLLEGVGYFLSILHPDGKAPTYAFTAHLDTVGGDVETPFLVYDDAFVFTTSNTILGADCKAGIALILHMVQHNKPGHYWLFFGEEVGCKGSGKYLSTGDFNGVNQCISLDRAGNDDVITHQMGLRCCSQEYANELSARLGGTYKPCSTGVYTDSESFTGVIPECTNLSVGYEGQHTSNEVQDLEHLDTLSLALLSLDFEALPIKRTPEKTYERYTGGATWYRGGSWEDWDDYYSYPTSKSSPAYPRGGLNSLSRNELVNVVMYLVDNGYVDEVVIDEAVTAIGY